MTKLIMVGGFPGAGKTTLLMESAKVLAEKGYRVGLITNDQVQTEPDPSNHKIVQRKSLR